MQKKIEIQGKFYKRVKAQEKNLCTGCVAYTTNENICKVLPSCHSVKGDGKSFIFVPYYKESTHD